MQKITKKELFKRYGYLMDRIHGKDEELLVDIMKCNGLEVRREADSFIVTED